MLAKLSVKYVPTVGHSGARQLVLRRDRTRWWPRSSAPCSRDTGMAPGSLCSGRPLRARAGHETDAGEKPQIEAAPFSGGPCPIDDAAPRLAIVEYEPIWGPSGTPVAADQRRSTYVRENNTIMVIPRPSAIGPLDEFARLPCVINASIARIFLRHAHRSSRPTSIFTVLAFRPIAKSPPPRPQQLESIASLSSRRAQDGLPGRNSNRVRFRADYYAKYPKPCNGRLGASSLMLIAPAADRRSLPCHAPEVIPGPPRLLKCKKTPQPPWKSVEPHSDFPPRVFQKFSREAWCRNPARLATRRRAGLSAACRLPGHYSPSPGDGRFFPSPPILVCSPPPPQRRPPQSPTAIPRGNERPSPTSLRLLCGTRLALSAATPALIPQPLGLSCPAFITTQKIQIKLPTAPATQTKPRAYLGATEMFSLPPRPPNHPPNSAACTHSQLNRNCLRVQPRIQPHPAAAAPIRAHPILNQSYSVRPPFCEVAALIPPLKSCHHPPAVNSFRV